jgi:AbrB family looped-hinge helix DNA binding protein
MSENVKNRGSQASRPRDRTKVSSKHQVTIPSKAFRTAGLEAGDTLRVEAQGAGQIVLTRVDELADRYSGCLDTGGELRAQRDKLRDEWR